MYDDGENSVAEELAGLREGAEFDPDPVREEMLPRAILSLSARVGAAAPTCVSCANVTCRLIRLRPLLVDAAAASVTATVSTPLSEIALRALG